MLRIAARRLCTAAQRDAIPMSIADRVEAEAVRKGTLSNLSGAGKPLPEEKSTQVHVASLPKNMEGRAEAEMRRAERAGLLKNLGGEGQPLAERHVVSGGSNTQQQAVQQHVQKESLGKK